MWMYTLAKNSSSQIYQSLRKFSSIPVNKYPPNILLFPIVPPLIPHLFFMLHAFSLPIRY